MKRHGEKPVVCLDQNWIGEIAKASAAGQAGPEEYYFSSLSTAIQSGVAEDRFVFPVPEFYTLENSGGPEDAQSHREVAIALSRGLLFNRPTVVSLGQLVQSAIDFVGLDAPPLPWWPIPFNLDPDTPANSLPPEDISHTDVSLVKSAGVATGLRLFLDEFDHRTCKIEQLEEGLSFEDEVESARLQITGDYHFSTFTAIKYYGAEEPGWEAFVRYSQHDPVLLIALRTVLEHGAGLEGFVDSADFKAAPFPMLYATLMAADILHFPDRTPEESLLDDIIYAAQVIPYSDVFATTCYLAELVDLTGVAQSYGCRVFSTRQKYELLGELSRM